MGYLTVAAMYAAFFGLGWLASRRITGGTAADFIVAGRTMPLWIATLTMTATWVDGGYLLGTAEGVYKSSLASGLQGGLCFVWFFTSDLVFVVLFPQLVCALFDPKANLTGSVVAFCVSLALRLGGGEPLFGVPPLIRYPEVFATVLPIDPAAWYDTATGALLFPYKTIAAATGMVLLPVVSRLTGRWGAPRVLRNPSR